MEHMDEVSKRRLLAQIKQRKENRNFEFKESMRWHTNYAKGTITKAILAMSNIEGGGFIVIGVKEDKKTKKLILTGITSKNHLDSFAEESMKRKVRKYADPYVDFEVDTIIDKQNKDKTYLVIRVHEFKYSPVICKADWKEYNLHKGKIYTRRDDPPESTEVNSEYFMREILDLAVSKYIKKTLKLLVYPKTKPVETSQKVKLEKELGNWK